MVYYTCALPTDPAIFARSGRKCYHSCMESVFCLNLFRHQDPRPTLTEGWPLCLDCMKEPTDIRKEPTGIQNPDRSRIRTPWSSSCPQSKWTSQETSPDHYQALICGACGVGYACLHIGDFPQPSTPDICRPTRLPRPFNITCWWRFVLLGGRGSALLGGQPLTTASKARIKHVYKAQQM